ncbi:MAG: substrate-binding domain-containing protein [Betaproteobacteria bacterium]|nr:substrate-binding domain-containing protein [Betaproteobacteria bacterium]
MASNDKSSDGTLKVLSAGAVKRGVAKIAQEFERETGTRVTVEFAPVPEVRKRVAAGESADVLVATPAAMDEFAAHGKIAPDSRGFVGRSRMGVVVHTSATKPDLSNTDAFKKVMLGASAVVYNRASSGLYAAKLLEKLGLVKPLGRRVVVVDTGAAIMEYVAGHPTAAVGLAQISEVMVMIDQGCAVKLAAPLPDAIQNITAYDAAAAAGAPDAAGALAMRFASDAAKPVFAATGIS